MDRTEGGLANLPALLALLMIASPCHSGQTPPSPGPRMTLSPGLAPVPDHRAVVRDLPPPVAPDGFRPLFNGVDLSGWHLSKSSNHGSTPLVVVRDGMIIATQNPPGRGGLLVSDEPFADFELYLEARGDWGNDSGILFRITEAGAGYQITLDTLPCGSVGRLEGVGGVRMSNQTATLGAAPPCWKDDPGLNAWRRDDWNVVRITVEGTAPHVSVTINDHRLADNVDDRNNAVGQKISGPIALQIHGGVSRWQPGGYWRWRNIAIRSLSPRR